MLYLKQRSLYLQYSIKKLKYNSNNNKPCPRCSLAGLQYIYKPQAKSKRHNQANLLEVLKEVKKLAEKTDKRITRNK